MLRNKNAPPTADLVQHYVDTAYDNVKLVADNLPAILALSEELGQGTFDDLLYTYNIDALAKLNAYVLDENIASEAYVDAAVVGLYDFKGGYDADTNTPNLDSSPVGVKKADTYEVTVGGLFFTTTVEPGDQLTATQDDPFLESHWSIVNRNIDSAAFATAEQGDTADSALQPGANITQLLNDANYADDQTPEEIETAYNTAVPVVSQVDAEAGISNVAKRWTPERVAQAARAQTGALVFVTADHVASASQIIFCDTTLNPITITLPAGATGSQIWIVDAAHYAATNNITIVPDGGGTDTIDATTEFILDQNENFCNVGYNPANTDWRVAISGVPELIEQAPHNHDGVYAPIDHAHSGFDGVNPQAGLTYEFVVADLKDLVTAENAAASTYSVPDGLGTPGMAINLYNRGAGEVTITMAGTDTLNTTDNNCAQGKAISIVKVAATEWAVIGGTAAP